MAQPRVPPAKRGKKQPKFSDRELQVLVDAICQVEPRLLGSEYHTTTSVERDEMWEEIVERVNAVGSYHRERYYIHKRWNDLRHRVKNTYAEAVDTEQETGEGGPATIKWTPWEEPMLQTLDPSSISGLEGGLDTEQNEGSQKRQRRRRPPTHLRSAKRPTDERRVETPGDVTSPLQSNASADASTQPVRAASVPTKRVSGAVRASTITSATVRVYSGADGRHGEPLQVLSPVLLCVQANPAGQQPRPLSGNRNEDQDSHEDGEYGPLYHLDELSQHLTSPMHSPSSGGHTPARVRIQPRSSTCRPIPQPNPLPDTLVLARQLLSKPHSGRQLHWRGYGLGTGDTGHCWLQ